jgi:hypothetical protein
MPSSPKFTLCYDRTPLLTFYSHLPPSPLPSLKNPPVNHRSPQSSLARTDPLSLSVSLLHLLASLCRVSYSHRRRRDTGCHYSSPHQLTNDHPSSAPHLWRPHLCHPSLHRATKTPPYPLISAPSLRLLLHLPSTKPLNLHPSQAWPASSPPYCPTTSSQGQATSDPTKASTGHSCWPYPSRRALSPCLAPPCYCLELSG